MRISLKAASFLPDCTDHSILYDESKEEYQKRRRAPVSEYSNLTCQYLSQVLQGWFDMPIPFISKGRAYLVQVLTDALGTGSLLVPAVWNLYTHLPSWLFSNSCPHVINDPVNQSFLFKEEFMEGLRQKLTSWDGLSAAHGDLQRLQAEFKTLYDLTDKHVEMAVSNSIKRRHLEQIASQLGQTSSGRIPVSHSFQRPAPHGPSSSGAHLGSGSSPSTSVLSEGLRSSNLVIFLRDAYAYINRTPTMVLNTPQMLMDRRSDYYMPLQESASSRRIVNAWHDPA